MARESVDEAVGLMSRHLGDRSVGLNIGVAVDWLNACTNDGGERSWWLTIAIMTALTERLPRKDKIQLLAQREFGELDTMMTVETWGSDDRDVLNKGYGAMTFGRPHQDKVYVFTRGKSYKSEILWRGPARVPQAAMGEYPKELWKYRKEVEPAYLGPSLWVWYPQSVFVLFDREAHKVGFYPTADLNSVSDSDNLSISRFVTSLSKKK